jgi:hypothetical protein
MFFKMSPLFATLLLVGGCYRNTIETGLPAANAMPYQETAQFFLWGLVGEETFDLKQICPTGVTRIEEEMAPVDYLFSCVTCGIYSPRTVTITCASGSAFLLTPEPDAGVTLVSAENPLASRELVMLEAQ